VGLVFWTWRRDRKAWHPPQWAAVLAGIVLGLIFFVRYHSGLHLIGISGALFLTARRAEARRAVLTMGAAYGLTVLGLGFLELELYPTAQASTLLAPFFNYLQYNWVEGRAAADYGVQPWHRYFSETAKFYGFAPAFVFGILMIRRRIQWPWAFMALFPLVALSLIAHKEGRFIYGSLWLWVPAAFCSLKFFSTAERRVWGTLVIGALVFGCIVNSSRVRSPRSDACLRSCRSSTPMKR
jgi:hypothetical protein